MKKYLIILLFPVSIYAHHTGSPDSPATANTRFIDPFTGKRERPNTYIVISEDVARGAQGNKNIDTTTAFFETTTNDGLFAFNVSVPYLYYDQKERSDAARIGKVYAGGKWSPLFNLNKDYFLVIEGRIGFPSGGDTDRFTGGNYYTGIGNLSAGYLYKDISIVGKVSGLAPIGSDHAKNPNSDDGVPYIFRSSSDTVVQTQSNLKKSTTYSFYLTYLFNQNFSFIAGFLYKTPFTALNSLEEEEKVDGIDPPRIFREASGGVSINFSERYVLSISYRNPLYRGTDFRPYESAITVAFSMELNSEKKETQDIEISPEKGKEAPLPMDEKNR
ncbi:MAG: hypothetical protein K8R21_06280 [Leptospira sp.]|nr:hypothetical protein [Leptospira sp.]